jgi:hypothetical protein
MTPFFKRAPSAALLILLTACNSTGSQVSPGESINPRVASPSASGAVPVSAMESMYVRLADVASGRAKRKSMISTVRANMRQQDAEIAATDTMRLASSGVSTVTNAALSGGLSLVEDGVGLAAQASGVGTVSGQMAIARAQQEAVLGQAEAQEAAMWADSEADISFQAAALLKVLDRSPNGKTTWRNSKTGASGTITVEAVSSAVSDGRDCRSALSIRDGATSGGVNVMTVCKVNSEWWIIN